MQNLYLTLSDDDLIRVVDMMKFDVGETEIWVHGRLHEACGSLNVIGVPEEKCSPRLVEAAHQAVRLCKLDQKSHL